MRPRRPSPSILVAFALLLAACASSRPPVPPPAENAVAVLGVSVREGVDAPVNRGGVALDLVERLEADGTRRVVPPRRVGARLGESRLRALLSRYAERGAVEPRDRWLLARAGLGARLAIAVRVESDTVRRLDPRYLDVVDAAGRVEPDRTRARLSTVRETVLSAELIDLASGESLGTSRYVAEPVRRATHTYYHGSSFGGSVAAALANRLVHGRSSPRHPSAASLRLTLRSLLDEVVRGVPTG